MRKALILFLFLALFAGCSTYEGAAYIKKDLNGMKCSNNSAQMGIDIKTAKIDCIKDIVDDEYFKGGAAYVVVDSIRDIDRHRYIRCMGDKGFRCDWPETGNK